MEEEKTCYGTGTIRLLEDGARVLREVAIKEDPRRVLEMPVPVVPEDSKYLWPMAMAMGQLT